MNPGGVGGAVGLMFGRLDLGVSRLSVFRFARIPRSTRTEAPSQIIKSIVASCHRDDQQATTRSTILRFATAPHCCRQAQRGLHAATIFEAAALERPALRTKKCTKRTKTTRKAAAFLFRL
jgi:hypothetical protein